MFFSIRFIVFMLYDTNVGPFIGKQVLMSRKIKKEPFFLTCIKSEGSLVIVMKYWTDKVSSEIESVNLSVSLNIKESVERNRRSSRNGNRGPGRNHKWYASHLLQKQKPATAKCFEVDGN